MRTLTIGLLAAATLALAIPAHADDITVGTSARGPSVGVREHANERVTVGMGEHELHCKVVIVKREGMIKKIKRCD